VTKYSNGNKTMSFFQGKTNPLQLMFEKQSEPLQFSKINSWNLSSSYKAKHRWLSSHSFWNTHLLLHFWLNL